MAESAPSNFGNMMLQDFYPSIAPEPVSWWPQTVGWTVVAILLVAAAGWWSFRRIQKWRVDRYRREALAYLDSLQKTPDSDLGGVIEKLPVVLKATALQAYQRVDVAALSGPAWLAFLDSHYAGPRFASETGRYLLRISYQPVASWGLESSQARLLLDMTNQWIREHTTCATCATGQHK